MTANSDNAPNAYEEESFCLRLMKGPPSRGATGGALFTRSMEPKAGWCWRRQDRPPEGHEGGHKSVRLVQNPEQRAPGGPPGSAELCAGKDDNRVWAGYRIISMQAASSLLSLSGLSSSGSQ